MIQELKRRLAESDSGTSKLHLQRITKNLAEGGLKSLLATMHDSHSRPFKVCFLPASRKQVQMNQAGVVMDTDAKTFSEELEVILTPSIGLI